jgi:hypothetical protein
MQPDTRAIHGAHAVPAEPTQPDNVSFRGIVWFLVVIFATTMFCQALTIGIFKLLEHGSDKTDSARAPLAAPVSMPHIEAGRVIVGTPVPEPNLLTDDPGTLARFRAQEDIALTTYGVVDKNAGKYRIPIDQAKDLLLKQGLPTRAK